jgi:hypothetical protein|tara:strand:- start:372 stop:647 length:276 start_codon:yes stop_codon:yes gene_type:complete
MNNVQTAINAIRNTDRNELNQIIEAVKLQQNFLARQSARSFMKGDAVQFTGRGNRTVVGTVIKVNPKTILVDSPSQGRWKVTASMLTSLEA